MAATYFTKEYDFYSREIGQIYFRTDISFMHIFKSATNISVKEKPCSDVKPFTYG